MKPIKKSALKLIVYLPVHISFLIFLFSVILSFIESRSIDINLKEGDKIPLMEIEHRLGLNSGSNVYFNGSVIELDEFEAVNPKNLQPTYISRGKLIRGIITNMILISVNNPIKLGAIALYQKGWSLGFRDLRFRFEGKDFGPDDITNRFITKSGLFFRFYPADVAGRQLRYYWEISSESAIQGKGYFINSTIPDILKDNGFSILKEDFYFISTLQANYKPYNGILAFCAVLFIITLGYSLILSGFEKNHGK